MLKRENALAHVEKKRFAKIFAIKKFMFVVAMERDVNNSNVIRDDGDEQMLNTFLI